MSPEEIAAEQERKREANRQRVAKCRAKKKAEAVANSAPVQIEMSYRSIGKKLAKIVENAAVSIGTQGLSSAWGRALGNFQANQPSIQNSRVKGINLLPIDYDKNTLEEALRNPYFAERTLGEISAGLRYTSYPYYKVIKTYSDILTYKNFVMPMYIKGEETKTEEWKREAMLLDKLNKKMRLATEAHKIVGLCATYGKVFCTLRTKIDKVHNQVDYAFLQELPQAWCKIIGFNNVSGYTVSFDLMYFMQPGTDVTQYGDLFLPYMQDFSRMFADNPDSKSSRKVVYQSKSFYPDNVRSNAAGSPQVFKQDGRWAYYVSLPVDKVWTFEIDDTTAATITPFSGMLMTYAQQSDYEAAQLSLVLNPLIKIFTGEIPYYNTNSATEDDGIRLSLGMRTLFETYFDDLMAKNNTTGAALFTAPVENIKSHDYAESANANEVSSSFNKYEVQKIGLSGLIPLDDPKAGQANLSALLESEYGKRVYFGIERMVNYLYESLNLKYNWQFKMFGSIYTDETTRKNAQTAIANGDTSAYFVLCALDDESWIDKVSMAKTINNSGLLDLLTPPPTSYTQSGKSGSAGGTGGRPRNETITEGNETTEDSERNVTDE